MFKKTSAILLFFILFFSSARAEQSSILINEIAWMGTEISSTDEWIELFNPTNMSIDISGWFLRARDGQPSIGLEGIIPARGYFLLERTDETSVPQKTANQIYVGSLTNTGEYLELFDSEENLFDYINMSTGWEHGDNDTKRTMERVLGSTWQTSLNIGGTPGSLNIVEEVEVLVTEENEETPTVTYNTTYSYSDILINEIVSDPADGDTEWIELFNNTSQKIDLEGWYIAEGSGTKTSLEGLLSAQGYFVVESPGGNLNNDGDEVLLFSPSDKLINDVVYGEWNDGDITDNAPVAEDPYSIARINGRDSKNNSNDFAISIKLTKGSSNIILNEEDYSVGNMDDYDFGQTIVVSEVFPNPEGNDKAGEFIELYNYGVRDVNLFGWQLGDNSKNRFEFKRGDTIGARAYLVLYRGDTRIALNNTGDSLSIYQAGAENAVYTLVYTKADEGFSFNNTKTEETDNFYNKGFIASNWTWSETISPGEKNIFKLVNHPPEVDFSFSENLFTARPVLFDSSDSFDIDGDELSYLWDFGDGFENILENPEHTYFKEGVYRVSLEVSDGENTSLVEKTIIIENRFELGEIVGDGVDELNFGETKIYISEILPNPDGDDAEGEFVEIYNAGDRPLNLFNWILDDMEGGSKPYRFETNVIIEPRDYFVLNRTESGIVLNNSYDMVRLIDREENVVDSVEYQKTLNAKSYSKNEQGEWVWTEEISPGNENAKVALSSDFGIDKFSLGDDLNYFSLKSPREVQDHGAGQMVLVEGVVNSLPGMFSSQYFYIEGDGGVQIYSNKKDFPQLAIGDLVQIRGEISKINQESRVKTKTRAEIVVIDRNYILTPAKLEGDLRAEHLGKLVLISGEIVEKSGNKFILENQDGIFNFEVKENIDIDKKTLNEGDKIELMGIVSSNKDTYVILPRFESDIIPTEEYSDSDHGEVLGEFGEKSEWNLEQKNNNRKYLYLFFYFLAVLSLIFLYKKTRE